MNLSNHKKLLILLEQINLSKEIIDEFFSNSYLKQLDVFQADKVWHFHIATENILPAKIFHKLKKRLKTSFQEIATIKLSLYGENKIENEQVIVDYWQLFLQTKNQLSPGIKQFVMEQRPKIEGHKLIIEARNHAELITLKERFEQPFKRFCQQVNLPITSLIVIENNKREAENFARFVEQKEREDQEIAANTRKAQEKRRNQNNNQSEGPLLIGQPINDEPISMQQIIEEERRITVQGYIFATELRQLRSGRSLLIIKATDYTDSLEIKMFSRDDEHLKQLEQVTKGLWIKARGRIQTDLYSNQLTMMANDLQQVHVAERM